MSNDNFKGAYTEDAFTPQLEDMVNHPPHYNKHGIECFDAIHAALDDDEFRGYIKGNIIKYTWRERYKNGNEDLLKGSWYLNKYLETLKSADES